MIWFLIYISGLVVSVYPVSRMILNGIVGDSPDTTDRFLGGMIALLLSAFWPLILVGIVAYQISERIWESRIREPR
jgi:hypothetical protein